MSAKRRAMHFGVFVLGTGNHSAGWRYDGAATSNNDLSVIQEIARQAERGKFDLLFVSDGLVMDPGDHPSFLCRFEPTTLISATWLGPARRLSMIASAALSSLVAKCRARSTPPTSGETIVMFLVPYFFLM